MNLIEPLPESPLDEGIDFGPLPDDINALLQEGVVAYRSDADEAERLFQQALTSAPDALPVYFCLYKIYTYRGALAKARDAADRATREAARQAGWLPAWCMWTPEAPIAEGAGRFALYSLKALAFIYLRQSESDAGAKERALVILRHLAKLDPTGSVGWPVVAALADGL